MSRGRMVVLIATLASAAPAAAETRGTVRLGVMSLDLESSSETPLFGDQVDRAVDRYNTVAAYDRASGGTTQPIDAGDLGVSETLLMISPGLELSAEHYFFRIEAPIGLSADLRSVGVGVYPLNVQAKPHREVTAYLSAGATASYLDRPGEGDVGGLIAVRAAGGVRFARRFLVELGYSAFALGGTVNQEKLDGMSLTAEDMQQPDNVISAGEARGLVDIALGVTF